MSYEPVDVFIEDQEERPVEGVVVRIFNASNSVAQTQGTTDADGKASFLLFTQDYAMRFYKYRVAFQQPQHFSVLEGVTNQFNVSAEVLDVPIANDARLCRCWGLFRTPSGAPQAHLDMEFYPEFGPILLDSNGVVPETVSIRTDEKGYAVIDLIRGGCYRVTVQGLDNEERYVRVPDLTSCNLPDLLFPIVKRVTFDPEGPYTVAVNAELVLTPTVYDSAGAVLKGSAQSDVQWSSSNPNVLAFHVTETTVVLRGVAPGSAELRAARNDLSIISIPSTSIEGQPIQVTVT